MKLRNSAFVVLAWVLAAAASGQNQAQQAKEEPLAFVKRAAAVANNVQPESVNGSLGIYISDQNWATGLKDGDLGPFLKVKEAKAGRSAACLFTQSKDAAVCVYFDGKDPSGVAAVKAGPSGKIEAGAIAIKPVSKEMLKKGTEEFIFTESNISTDDGQPLPAFVVTPAKPKA
jgi:hypothetical protein